MTPSSDTGASSGLTLFIEGKSAEAGAAVEELANTPGLEVRVHPPSGAAKRSDDVLSLVANLIQITGGVAWAVQFLRTWLAKRNESGRGLAVVVEYGKGQRLRLNGASPEQVAALLQRIAKEDEP